MNYISSIIRLHYGTCDRKKMSKDVFSKELNGCFHYAQLEAYQLLINKFIEGYSADEIIGELQKLLGEKYKDCNKIFGLYKMPSFDIDRIIKECEEKRNERA